MERVDKIVRPPINNTCGNGIREFPEECDRDDFGFYTCANVQTRGYCLTKLLQSLLFYFCRSTGNLTCTNECKINSSDCTITEVIH